MKQLSNYVFYSGCKCVGICKGSDWDKWKYIHEPKPFVMSILPCTQEYIDCLFDALDSDQQIFIDMIREEIKSDLFKIIMN